MNAQQSYLCRMGKGTRRCTLRMTGILPEILTTFGTECFKAVNTSQTVVIPLMILGYCAERFAFVLLGYPLAKALLYV